MIFLYYTYLLSTLISIAYLQILGTILHFPFSFYYHIGCAKHAFNHPIDCVARKLDQTFVHVASMLYAYALSKSMLYTCGCILLNSYFILRLWVLPIYAPSYDRAWERRMNMFIGVMMYLLPILVRYVA